ncbi:MAG: MATE family efflux transporter [Elusimicrobiota bacterium]
MKFINKKTNKVDLISGSPLKGVLLLSSPIIISNLMHVLYNIADIAWLGVLGKEEVAAMAFVFPVLFVVISLGIGLGIAGSVLVAQYEGAGESEEGNIAAGQTLVFSFMFAVFISLSGYFLSGPIVNFLGASPDVKILAESYLKIIFAGAVLIFPFFIFNSLMRGWGNSSIPMKIIIFSNIINIVLDPFLIFGIWIFPEMGIGGAAVATVFSRFAASLISLWFLFKGAPGLSINAGHLIPRKAMMFKLCRLGWPVVIEHALKGMGMMAITAIASVFGTAFMAGYSVGIRVFSLFVMPSLAVGKGVAASVGQNLGAGLSERSSRVTFQSSGAVFAFLSFIAAGVFLLRFDIALFFLGENETQAVIYAARFLMSLAIAAPFLGAAMAARGAFKGAGRTLQSMTIGIIGMWVLRVGFAYYYGVIVGKEYGVWNSFIVGGAGELMLCIIYYLKGNWLVPVIEKNGLDEEYYLTRRSKVYSMK